MPTELFVCAVSHSQEQHHQIAGREPAAEEWKQPYSAEGTATFWGTTVTQTQIYKDIPLSENTQKHRYVSLYVVKGFAAAKMELQTGESEARYGWHVLPVDVVHLGNPRWCDSGERHIQTVASGFGWDVQRGSKATEGGMSAQTGQTVAACACVCNIHGDLYFIYMGVYCMWCYFQDVENELVVQVSMKQEMELAMKLLEKDIHEKQVSTHFHSAFFFGHWFIYKTVHWLKQNKKTLRIQQYMERQGLYRTCI